MINAIVEIIKNRNPVDVNSNKYSDFDSKTNDKDPNFKVGDYVRILKYKNNFAKGYTLDWSEEIFVNMKLKTLYHGHMLLVILMVKNFSRTFCEKKL